MDNFLGILGIFDRVARLREEPLLADIYADVDNLRNSDLEELLSAEPGVVATRYIGQGQDKENFIKDRRNLASDFSKAINAAKQRLGA